MPLNWITAIAIGVLLIACVLVLIWGGIPDHRLSRL